MVVAYSFSFAMKAGINTGVLPCIFAMTTFYISVIFYFKLNERISLVKLVGIVLDLDLKICTTLSHGPFS